MKPHRRVFHFTLRDLEGRVLDTSVGGEPVAYVEGAAQIIPGLESQLRDEPAGKKFRVQVPAADAYGERDPDQVQKVKRAALPVEGPLKAGDTFRAGDDAHAAVVTVVAVDGDEITLDANHPLAGVSLIFDIEIMEARLATDTEIQAARSEAAAAEPPSGNLR